MVDLPNVLWIVTTQWRAQAFGFAGDINARTPHLDHLATESVNHVQAVTPHPFGPFARAAILTGRHSPANGVGGYFDALPDGARTVAHDLADRGYHTAYFGKWHLSDRDPAAALVGETHAKQVVRVSQRGGFQFWEGFESGFLLNDPWLHGTRLPEPRKFTGYQSDVLCDRAGEYLSTRSRSRVNSGTQTSASTHEMPWFAVVSLEAPHPPYSAPSAGVPPPDAGNIQLRANVPQEGDVELKARRELAGYYAHVEATDRAIGRLLRAIPLASTLVVFTSVHGDMHGSQGLFRKGWPYEESVRVPLLIRYPRKEVHSVGEMKSAISLVDLRRFTVAWTDHRSALEEQRSSFISMPSVVDLPHQCDRIWRGLRTPSRKLILFEDGTPWLFYDLVRDPLERENRFRDPAYAAEIAALREELATVHSATETGQA
jgi:arylsulfatase A-like enzyme